MQKVIFQFAVEPELLNSLFVFLSFAVAIKILYPKSVSTKRIIAVSSAAAISSLFVFVTLIGLQFKFDVVIDYSNEIAFLKLRAKDFGYIFIIPFWMYLWQKRAPKHTLKNAGRGMIVFSAAVFALVMCVLLKIFELVVTENVLFM